MRVNIFVNVGYANFGGCDSLKAIAPTFEWSILVERECECPEGAVGVFRDELEVCFYVFVSSVINV